jgi:hypothetical protein
VEGRGPIWKLKTSSPSNPSFLIKWSTINSLNPMVHFSLLCLQVNKWMVVIYSWNSMVDLALLFLQAKENFHL